MKRSTKDIVRRSKAVREGVRLLEHQHRMREAELNSLRDKMLVLPSSMPVAWSMTTASSRSGMENLMAMRHAVPHDLAHRIF